MKRWTVCASVLLLAMLGLPPARAEAPMQAVGDYRVGIARVARVIDFSLPAPQSFVAVTMFVSAPNLAALDRVLGLCQEATLEADGGAKLRYQQTEPASNPDPQQVRRYETLWFSAPKAGARSLQALSGALRTYRQRVQVQMDFISVAGEPATRQQVDGLTASLEYLGPGDRREGQQDDLIARLRLQFTAPAGGEEASDWLNQRLELIDAEGRPRPASDMTTTFGYDEKLGAPIRNIVARFVGLARVSPRGLRYRADKVTGVETVSYRFENLPLP